MTKTVFALFCVLPFLAGFAVQTSLNGAGPEAGFLGMFLIAIGVIMTFASGLAHAFFADTKFAGISRGALLMFISGTIGLIV
jgi:hypothetical protein